MTFCNTRYQDTMTVSLTDSNGQKTTLLAKRIDDLCGSVSAAQATIPQDGDDDGTAATGWQSVSGLDVSAFAGSKKDVKLTFEVGDVGDHSGEGPEVAPTLGRQRTFSGDLERLRFTPLR